MLAAVKSAILTTFNGSSSRLGQPARFQPPVRQPSCSPFGLCQFPQELLTMVLEELDWSDILRVRMVCKTLQEASKTRSVRLNFCRPHFSPTATAPQTLHLERPIKLYTAYDLEFLFLRLKGADIKWMSYDNPPARKREIETTNTAKCMCLLEGGRWLLVASDSGCIAYFDLEATTPTESILIPAQFDPLLPDRFESDGYDPCAEIKVLMAIDRDNDSAFLAFNLAVSFCLDNNPPPDPKAQSVRIWRVALALDDQQRGIGLTAEHLASFPLEPSIDQIFFLSLRGPHIALNLLAMEHEDCQLTFIIDWTQADVSRTNYKRRLLHPPYGKVPKAIHFLPDNKLFIVADVGIMIFDYSSIPETDSLPPLDFTDATIAPLWRVRGLGINLGPQPASISRPFFCSGSIRFSVRARDDIYGVIIDYPYNEGSTEPLGQVVKLMDKLGVNLKRYEYYGYNRSIILAGDDGTYLFNYPWPDEQIDDASLASLHIEGPSRDFEFGPFLDEQSGRVAVPTDMTSRAEDSRDRIDIWDFALVYK